MHVSSEVVRITLRAMMEDSDRCMDSECVSDISNATDSPRRRNGTTLPASLYHRVARGREIETRPISRVLHVMPT